MPAYQYQCTECHESFQIRKSIAEIDTQTFCPECGSPRTERLISNVTFFSSTDGSRRAIAGAPSCAGCGAVGTGCASCHPR